MNILIVHAHPEPQSFNAALTDTARTALTAAGHTVTISDLYAQRFEPRSDRHNFTTTANPDFLKLQDEERHATEHDSFAPDIHAELAKLEACDALIFQFPLWWFGMPAILKGWVDRVFAAGRVYGNGKWYDRGAFAGKRAIASTTTGGPDTMYGPDGLGGDINTLMLPINRGVFSFVGFDVLPPFVAWSVSHIGDEGRRAYLDQWRARLQTLFTDTPIAYPRLDEFDPKTFQRKA